MSGFGLQGGGTTNAGWGSPTAAYEQLGDMLAVPETSVMTGARKIDPKTKDYELDANGRLVGMNAVQQIVLLAVSTESGSAAVKSLGNRLRGIDRVTNNFRARCLNVLTDALRTAISQRLVEVLGFTTFKAGPKDGLQPGQTYGRLRWRDLTTGQEYQETI